MPGKPAAVELPAAAIERLERVDADHVRLVEERAAVIDVRSLRAEVTALAAQHAAIELVEVPAGISETGRRVLEEWNAVRGFERDSLASLLASKRGLLQRAERA